MSDKKNIVENRAQYTYERFLNFVSISKPNG